MLAYAWPKLAISGTGRALAAKSVRCESTLAQGNRLYFTRRGKLLIVMLVGGDKSSQSRDIKRAQRVAKQLELD